MAQSLLDMIAEFLREYGERHNLDKLGMYPGLVRHALYETGELPTDEKPLAECIKKAFSGKKVAELGCRGGEFLYFLNSQGAIVAGSTGDKHFEKAQKLIGGKAVLVKANAEDAGPLLAGFKPDMIFSHNLFEPERWQGGVPYENILRSFGAVAERDTLVFVHPEADTGRDIFLGQESRLGLKFKTVSDYPHEVHYPFSRPLPASGTRLTVAFKLTDRYLKR